MTGTAKAPPLGLTMTLIGAHPMIAARLAQAGFRSAAPPALLVNADEAPDLASIAQRCTEFANAAPDGTERLIVTILPQPAHGFRPLAGSGHRLRPARLYPVRPPSPGVRGASAST